jgi:multidrug efflux pump subunit AcrA (membrane-fusion protein)
VNRRVVVNVALLATLALSGAGAALAVGDPTPASASGSRTVTAAIGDVTASVSASGNLSAATTVGVNFTGSGGTLKAIYVKVGQQVTLGQALAKVDDTAARETVRSAEANLASAQAQRATTTEGQTGAERARDQASINSAQVGLNNAKVSLSQARATYSLDMTQQDALVAAAKAAYDAATSASSRASALAAWTQARNTRDSTSLRDRQQIQSIEGQVRTAEASVTSQRAAAAVNSQPPRQGAVSAAAAQVTSAAVQVATARTTLDQTVLRAPVAGTVASIAGVVGGSSSASSSSSSSSSSGSSTSTTSSSSGATSATGFIVLTNLSDLQVTSLVAEADASKVKLGQQATITFSAASVTATGRVTHVDVQDTVSNNVVEYGVTVSLDSVPAGLKLGQTASVSITTGTAKQVLSVPTSVVTTVGNLHTVTVRKNGKDTVVPVQTGLAGDQTTEIISGLAAGAVLVMPTTTTGTTGFTFPGRGLGGGGAGRGLGG